MHKHIAPLAALFLILLQGCNTHRSSPPPLTENRPSPRTSLFNSDWRFLKADPAGASAPLFDDSSWASVQLPHDWSIQGPIDPNLASSTGFLPAGIGWYRKSFTLPDAERGRHIVVQFDGIYKNSRVWCNGQFLGLRPSGYTSFEYDLTPYLRWDNHPNVLAVRVDHSDYADSRWYSGSGIYRNVWLIDTNPIHVANWGTYVTTPHVSADSADVKIETTLRNDSSADADVSVACWLMDPQGNLAARAITPAHVAAGSQQTIAQTVPVAHPTLWSVDFPQTYVLKTQVLQDGQPIDACSTPMGIRSIRFDPNAGFFLNDVNLKLKGVCLHEDAGALGSAIPIQVWERRLRELRDAGCNAIRTSHNPPAPEFLDLCDKMGFLVMDEAFDEWTQGKRKWIDHWNGTKFSTDGYHTVFDEWAETDLRDMIQRDRNHPSIILWSVGNEIDYPNDPYPPNSPLLGPIAARLIQVVRAGDASRPITAACAAIESNLFYPQLDVVGYNYQEKRYAADHQQHPDRILFGSENKHDLPAWQAVADNPFISGQFLWTGIDYMGESRRWPNRASADGLIDLAGFPKPQYYFRQSLWSDKPMVYLTPSTRGDGVTCYTNCQSVELFQNGKSLGEKPLPPGRVLTWPVALSSGRLNAVGKRDGVACCDFDLKQPGPPRKLTLSPDATFLEPNTQDTSNVEVDITDPDGERVTNAANPITCTLTGPAHLLAMENGDLADHTTGPAPTKAAYHGRLILYIQAEAKPGTVTVTVSTPGLDPASVKLDVK